MVPSAIPDPLEHEILPSLDQLPGALALLDGAPPDDRVVVRVGDADDAFGEGARDDDRGLGGAPGGVEPVLVEEVLARGLGEELVAVCFFVLSEWGEWGERVVSVRWERRKKRSPLLFVVCPPSPSDDSPLPLSLSLSLNSSLPLKAGGVLDLRRQVGRRRPSGEAPRGLGDKRRRGRGEAGRRGREGASGSGGDSGDGRRLFFFPSSEFKRGELFRELRDFKSLYSIPFRESLQCLMRRRGQGRKARPQRDPGRGRKRRKRKKEKGCDTAPLALLFGPRWSSPFAGRARLVLLLLLFCPARARERNAAQRSGESKQSFSLFFASGGSRITPAAAFSERAREASKEIPWVPNFSSLTGAAAPVAVAASARSAVLAADARDMLRVFGESEQARMGSARGEKSASESLNLERRREILKESRARKRRRKKNWLSLFSSFLFL